MLSKLFDSGKCVMKSILMDSKQVLGTGNGCNNPAGFYVEVLFYWHITHVSQNKSMAERIVYQ